MNQRQVLTGAANAGDNCYSVGSVEGVPFTAYTAGCNIVILASNFERVQIIPGILYGNVQVNCLDCATDVGKIAAAYGRRVYIFEPTPILDENYAHRLNYKWIQTATIETEQPVSVLSWNLEGTKLLTGGSSIQLWHWYVQPTESSSAQFTINESNCSTCKEESCDGNCCADRESSNSTNQVPPVTSDAGEVRWKCVWQCSTASNVCFLSFSPDGSLFVSAGKSDRLAKIWYKSAASQDYSSQSSVIGAELMQKRLTAKGQIGVNYTFVYIAHPRAITGICWRRTSKYMPKSSVANMLVTSCKDNICRLWIQTLLPEDGLVNFNSIEGLEHHSIPRVHTTRHRQKIMQRLRTMKHFGQFGRRRGQHGLHDPETEDGNESHSPEPIPNLPNSMSVHDFHCFGIHGSAMVPGIHFHLAASINAKSDIPLVPRLDDELGEGSGEKTQPTFVMHWLNNKEMVFTQQAEKLLQQISRKIFRAEMAEDDNGEASDDDECESNFSHESDENDQDLYNGHALIDPMEAEQDLNQSTINTEAGRKLRHKLCRQVGGGKKKNKKKRQIPNDYRFDDLRDKATIPEESSVNNISTADDQHPHGTAKNSIHTVSSSQSNVEMLLNNQPAGTTVSSLGDFIDRKFETLLREWHNSYDLLFAIHPVDGSLLVWLVEWLDETCPGSFRQAQVSFSSRIPNAIPLGDAFTMSHNVSLYSPHSFLDLRSVILSHVRNQRGESTAENGDANEDEEGPDDYENVEEKIADEENRLLQPLDDSSGSLLLTPTICMVTKHNNGSLNLWHVGFAEQTNFTQVLSISHRNRVCGHRFRVNDVSCHPVLPLLLTTSHHNLPGGNKSNIRGKNDEIFYEEMPHLHTSSGLDHSFQSSSQMQGIPNLGFCSELILWKVDSVGPLSKSGGVTELARINSPNISAFANVAWIPTLLPSSTLGSISNSPSACFIASDGKQLHVYQAVIDARTLLAEMNSIDKQVQMDSSGSFDEDAFNDYGRVNKGRLRNTFKIVSLQSTSRPGCILELDEISEATHDWQNTQLLHVFQAQLIRSDLTAYRSWQEKQNTGHASLFEPGMGAVVDLRNSDVFEEPFYLVLIEKTGQQQSVLHMWKLVVASHTEEDEDPYSFVPDSNLVQEQSESGGSSRTQSPDATHRKASRSNLWKSLNQEEETISPLKIKTTKVCTQILELPEDVEVIHATPAAGHLSSSNIYPACFAPYLLCTACSDGSIRFWKCQVSPQETATANESTAFQATEIDDQESTKISGEEQLIYKWEEWEFMIGDSKSSSIQLPGLPLYVSCAYSGRIACAYKDGQSYSRPTCHSPDKRFININLSIFECESTGGSEWILEDTIHLKNILIPQSENSTNFELGPLIDTKLRNRKTADTLIQRLGSQDQPDQIDGLASNYIERLLSVPSYSTMQSLKRIISEQGNQFTLTQKSIVQLDWVSTEDGSHVLTVSVGNKISVFTPVSTDIAQANLQAMKASLKTGTTSNKRMLLKQTSSMAATMCVQEDVRWMSLRTIELQTADSLPPLPMQMSWVRDGILVVGMDNEMHVYTQWKCNNEQKETALLESRVLTERGLFTHAQESSQLRIPNHGLVHRSGSTNGFATTSIPSTAASIAEKATVVSSTIATTTANVNTEENDTLSQLPDFGIFEASRLACPVLPQYHPKQLMELLSFGKVQRVKAILNHLVISICSLDSVQSGIKQNSRFLDSERSGRSWSRSRTLSIAGNSLSPNPLDMDANLATIPEDLQLDYTEITSIRPLPLFALIQAEFEKQGKSSDKAIGGDKSGQQSEYDSLFSNQTRSQVEETLDEILGKSSFNFNAKAKKTGKMALTDFGPKQASILTKLLTHSHLPGLSSLDQMHLLALADAVGSFNSTPGEKLDQNSISPDSLDDCGLRYILTLRQHTYLLCCLPLIQRKQLQKQGLASHNLVWAFHSETQEELIQMLPCVQKKALRWSDLREMGVGWWVRNNTVLRKLIEQLAHSSYKANNDPLDPALFYIAMKKKSVIHKLYTSAGNKRMGDFFVNDFTEEKWRKAALKNAFALLGKQRFEHAAAFFLLAGSVWDAVEVCLNKMDDFQLAMVIIRLYEGDLKVFPPTLEKILNQEILGYRTEMESFDNNFAHPDPFYRSMAYWILQDYNSSLSTLLELDIGHSHPKYNASEMDRNELNINPSVFNFYLYLRNQPLIVRRQLAKSIQERRGKGLLQENNAAEIVTPFERRLYFLTAHQHFRAGCPSLALEVLSRLPNRILFEESRTVSKQSSVSCLPENEPIFSVKESKPTDRSDAFDWGAPSVVQNPQQQVEEAAFDWGAPVASQLKRQDSGFKIELSSSESEEDEDEGLKMKSSEKEPKIAEAQSSKPTSTEEEPEKKDAKLDIMAQQLRFIACLKILMEELSTLATGFEVDGGQLRYHLYVWLEKSVQALRSICNYRTFSMRWQEADAQLLSERPCGMLAESDLTPCDPNRSGETAITGNLGTAQSLGTGFGEYKPTLHEILLADKMDFEVKLQRAARRKKWLQSNESLLRTLLSYCSLHGAHGGGLAAVRMELILLLQELQQQRTQHQLLSPLPFPTTLPLLAASVACQKTVIADPIKHLHSNTHDILESIAEMRTPPLQLPPNYCEIYVLRDLGISLSACVYQSLCDADYLQVKQSAGASTGNGGPTTSSHRNFLSTSHQSVSRQLTGGSDASGYTHGGGGSSSNAGSTMQGNVDSSNGIGYLNDEILESLSEPIKWPGVQSLRALLARDKDEDSPKLHTLLCEAYIAVYLSQLLFSLAACDSHVLFRLVTLTFDVRNWAQLFGGGIKRLLHVARSGETNVPAPKQPSYDESSESAMNLLNAFSKQRRNFHMKILQQLNQEPKSAGASTYDANMKENKPTYREQFIPPQMSILSYLMSRPQLPDEFIILDYDSSESVQSEPEEDLDDFNEYSDLNDPFEDPYASRENQQRQQQRQRLYEQYAWAIIRKSVLMMAKEHVQQFLTISGLEMQDLPTISPLLHALFKVIDNWLHYMHSYLCSFSEAPFTNILPNSYVQTGGESTPGGPAMNKYKALLEINNTPFRSHNSASRPVKRLWNYLVRQELTQPIFIRYIFGKRKILGDRPTNIVSDLDTPANFAEDVSSGVPASSSNDPNAPISLHPTRIVHKDQDLISAFCVNHSNPGLIALATPKEIQELNISVLLGPVPWLEEEAEYDILNLLRGPDSLPSTNYLVVQHPSDRLYSSPANIALQNTSFPSGSLSQTGRSTIMVKSHKLEGTRRMCSHPTLPLYLSGAQDGSVRLWEWNHQQELATPQQPGKFAKVTRVQFNQLGNKFGVSDADGNLSLWQVALQASHPFYTVKANSKQCSDFTFLGSSSVVVTAGESLDHRNVSLWDTLLKARKSRVASFACLEAHGASAVLFCPLNQLLLAGGRRGELCVLEVRQKRERARWQAHETAVKCMALEPGEAYFATGSADGDIKVWALGSENTLLFFFPGEHARNTLFRNLGMGVSHLYIDAQSRLFSCGADGSMKMRQLPDKTGCSIVNFF